MAVNPSDVFPFEVELRARHPNMSVMVLLSKVRVSETSDILDEVCMCLHLKHNHGNMFLGGDWVGVYWVCFWGGCGEKNITVCRDLFLIGKKERKRWSIQGGIASDPLSVSLLQESLAW